MKLPSPLRLSGLFAQPGKARIFFIIDIAASDLQHANELLNMPHQQSVCSCDWPFSYSSVCLTVWLSDYLTAYLPASSTGHHLCEAFAGSVGYQQGHTSQSVIASRVAPISATRSETSSSTYSTIVRVCNCGCACACPYVCTCMHVCVCCHTLCLCAYKSVQQALVKKGVNNKYW